MGKFIDLTGQKFGRLLVESKAPRTKNRTMWNCVCECGNKTRARGEHLTLGRSQSCGCLAIELQTRHGMARTPAYHAWQAMKDRCYNTRNKQHKDYGARGISVYPEWLDSFDAFYADMGERPSINHSLDRINNDLGYSKDNCRWATAKDQVINRRNSLMCEIGGRTQCVKDWCKELRIVSYGSARRRISIGWSIKDAVTVPPRSRKPSKKRHR